TRMVRRPSLIYGLLEALEAVAVDDAPAVAEAWADEHGIDLLEARAALPSKGSAQQARCASSAPVVRSATASHTARLRAGGGAAASPSARPHGGDGVGR